MAQDFPAWDGDVPTVLDSTMMNAFLKCPRYFQLSVLEGWKPKEQSIHLIFGGHFASALELFFLNHSAGVEYEENVRLVVRHVLIQSWDAEEDRPWASHDSKKNRANLIRTVIWYLEFWKDEPTEVVTLPNGQPAVELSVKFELTPEVLYSCHIDRLVTFKDITYVMDQKTTGGTMSPKYFSRFKPDIQMGGYLVASQVALDIPAQGVLIDAAQIAVNFTRFGRGFISYPDKLIADWYSQMKVWSTMIRQMSEQQVFPMNPGSCLKYGEDHACDFYEVCTTLPSLRKNVLKSNFVKGNRWDPILRDMKGADNV